MGTITRKFHLPTINFQGYVSFGGNKWFFLYHSWLYSPSLWWLQKCWLLYPPKPASKISPQVAPTYPVHNVADLAVPKKGGEFFSEVFWLVVSNIFYFHPYLGKIPILTNIFQMGWNHQPVLLKKKSPLLLSTCPVSAYRPTKARHIYP